MPVTQTNIIIGPCTSFKVDSTDIGATAGGVTVDMQDKFQDVEVDQVAGVVAKGITTRTMTVKTQLAEATLENLQIAWNQSKPVTTDAQAGTKTLGIGLDLVPPYHALTFIGPGPGGKQRTFTVHKAVTSGASYDIAKDKPGFYSVTFECVPDLSQPAGQEFGTVVDG